MEAPPPETPPDSAKPPGPDPASRRKSRLVVGVLLGTIVLTTVSVLVVRARFGPAPACDYESPACEPNRLCTLGVGGQGRCLPFTERKEPLGAPFRSGERFACIQGPRAARGRAHSAGTDVFAVDLAPAPDRAEVDVLAPLGGEARVFDQCEERDASPSAHDESKCGVGYGNHVRIWDGTDLVLLGHLARVRVADGARVERGDVIGTAGASGAAGTRHVHLVVTRLRPGDHIGTILGSVGHKGGVVVRPSLSLRPVDVEGASGGALLDAGVFPETSDVPFDELACDAKPEYRWAVP